MSLFLSNALILLARFARQMKSPPSDADFEALMTEKSNLETQLSQEQRSAAALQATIDQLEKDLKKQEDIVKIQTQELENLKAQASSQTG